MKRVGILGTGSIANVHLDGWQRLPVSIAAHYDIRTEAAQRAATLYGGQACSDLDEFFNLIDIVDICTPTPAHKANVLAAAAAGKAIICEKPLARTASDCQEIVACVEAAGVPMMVAQVVRWFPMFAKAKAVIDSGAIGKPGVIRTVRAGSHPSYGSTFPSKYYSDFEQSGGVILDVGVHDIDFQRWCCGEVERVFAQGLSFRAEGVRDHALITLKFVSGAIGHIECSWAHPPRNWRTRLEIAGDQGLIEWDRFDDAPLLSLLTTEQEPNFVRNAESPSAPEDDPYYLELKHFLECVEAGRQPAVSARDGMMAVQIGLAAIESVRTHRPVEVAHL